MSVAKRGFQKFALTSIAFMLSLLFLLYVGDWGYYHIFGRTAAQAVCDEFKQYGHNPLPLDLLHARVDARRIITVTEPTLNFTKLIMCHKAKYVCEVLYDREHRLMSTRVRFSPESQYSLAGCK